MRHWEAKHYAILGAMIVALGTQLAGVEHGWADVTHPTFIGGVLIQVGTTVAALYVGAPTKPFDPIAAGLPATTLDRRNP